MGSSATRRRPAAAATRTLEWGLAAALIAALAACSDDNAEADAGDWDSGYPADAWNDTDDAFTVPDADAEVDLDVAPDAFPDIDGDVGPAIEIEGLTIIENPTNVLAVYVSWQTSREGSTVLHVQCGDELDQTIRDAGPRTRHEVFVMGLLTERSCTFTAESVDLGRRRATASESYEVPSLPEGLPGFRVRAPAGSEGIAQLQPGWTLAPLANQIDRTSHFAVLVDQRGRVRWYRELPNFALGADNDIHEVPQGVLFGTTSERTINDPVILSWEGEEVWRAEITMHHHISVDPNDGTYLYLGRNFDCPPGPNTKSDTVERYDPVLEETVWVWNTCDHYTPEGGHVDDWDHLNTIEVFPGDDDLLISVRNENQLWRIDPVSGDIVWRMGAGGQFAMDAEDYFLHQHAPQILPNDNILLFDNGLPGVRQYSRVIEIAYDVDDMEAEVVWEYRHDPDIFSQTMGQAYRVANGNTVATFTGRSESQPSVIVEVDAAGEELWELESEPKWAIYRTRRVEARFGYVIGATDGEAE